MDNKILKLKQATAKVKKITLYHIITPINDEQFAQMQHDGFFNPSKNALGGQSNGYYFFTTYDGVEHHIKTMRDTWDLSNNKHVYIVECEINMDDIKYPNWKLDYEATQDFLFDMIYNVALIQKIKFDGIEISVDNKKLNINVNGKFSRISEFNANHSGLIEQIADYLYKHNKQFQNEYDELLLNVFTGKGKNPELYAVKTTEQQKIANVIRIENKSTPLQPANDSQINKFFARYGKSRH